MIACKTCLSVSEKKTVGKNKNDFLIEFRILVKFQELRNRQKFSLSEPIFAI